MDFAGIEREKTFVVPSQDTPAAAPGQNFVGINGLILEAAAQMAIVRFFDEKISKFNQSFLALLLSKNYWFGLFYFTHCSIV